MIGRKNQGIFYSCFGNCSSFRSGDVFTKTWHLLSIANLVGFAHNRDSGHSRLVRLAVVEKPSRRLLRGQQI